MRVRADTEQNAAKNRVAADATYARVLSAPIAAVNVSAATLFPAADSEDV